MDVARHISRHPPRINLFWTVSTFLLLNLLRVEAQESFLIGQRGCRGGLRPRDFPKPTEQNWDQRGRDSFLDQSVLR